MHQVVGDFLKSLKEGLGRALASAVLLSPDAHQVLRQFRQAGALTADSAQPFHPQSPGEVRAFEELLKLTVIRQPRPGRYFLDERTLRRLGLP